MNMPLKKELSSINDFIEKLAEKHYIDCPVIIVSWQGEAPCGFSQFNLDKAVTKKIIGEHATEYLKSAKEDDDRFIPFCELANANTLALLNK